MGDISLQDCWKWGQPKLWHINNSDNKLHFSVGTCNLGQPLHSSILQIEKLRLREVKQLVGNDTIGILAQVWLGAHMFWIKTDDSVSTGKGRRGTFQGVGKGYFVMGVYVCKHALSCSLKLCELNFVS